MKALLELFIGKHFDFYAPYTPQEVRQRLQNLSERDYRRLPFWRDKRRLLKITIEPIDRQSFRFRGERREMFKHKVVTVGTVHQDGGGVQVRGTVRLAWITLLSTIASSILFVMFAFGTLFVVRPHETETIIFIQVFCYGGLILGLWQAIDIQTTLYREMLEGLGKSQKKKKNDQ